MTTDAVSAIHDRLREELAARHVTLDGLSFCPHAPDEGCACRKPKPGMLIAMMGSLGVSPDHTIVLGDSIRDIEAGLAAGCRCILVRSGNGARSEGAVRSLGVNAVFDDLRAAVDALLEEEACS
jgi:D-glycero-D-manno-heptose 1,7-bisphosphate phosphatase